MAGLTRHGSSRPVRGGEVTLRTRQLGVSFGGHRAVQDADAQFVAGTLTAIVGPNGAGKTTFFNLVSGQLPATTGKVFLRDEDVSSLSAAARTVRGIGRAFQLTNLFPKLTVLENVMLAVQGAHRGPHGTFPLQFTSLWKGHADIVSTARQLLVQTKLEAYAGSMAASLSHGDQRKLEVAILMALDPHVYMFDEPTAGMTREEAPVILNLIRSLKQQPDKTILLVEHKMDVVSELADRVMVMHEGKIVAEGLPKDVMALPVVQEAYLGKARSVTEAAA